MTGRLKNRMLLSYGTVVGLSTVIYSWHWFRIFPPLSIAMVLHFSLWAEGKFTMKLTVPESVLTPGVL
jgi:hypothetical protein